MSETNPKDCVNENVQHDRKSRILPVFLGGSPYTGPPYGGCGYPWYPGWTGYDPGGPGG